MGVGVSLAVLCIPILLEWLQWQTIWVLLGGLCLLIALMVHRYLHLEPQVPTSETASLSATSSSFWEIVRVTITHPPILCLAVIFACYTSQWLTVIGFLPSMYVANQIDLKTAGMLASLVVVSNLGGTFGAGMLLQRGWQPKTLLWSGFISMMLTSFLAFAARSWLMLELQVLSAVLFSLIGGIIPTTVFAITLKYAPQANVAAASVGLVLQVSAFAQFFVPPLSASLVSATGQWANIALVTVCLSVLGLMMSSYLFRRHGK